MKVNGDQNSTVWTPLTLNVCGGVDRHKIKIDNSYILQNVVVLIIFYNKC